MYFLPMISYNFSINILACSSVKFSIFYLLIKIMLLAVRLLFRHLMRTRISTLTRIKRNKNQCQITLKMIFKCFILILVKCLNFYFFLLLLLFFLLGINIHILWNCYANKNRLLCIRISWIVSIMLLLL